MPVISTAGGAATWRSWRDPPDAPGACPVPGPAVVGGQGGFGEVGHSHSLVLQLQLHALDLILPRIFA
jgi:hypothetical protein